MSRAENAAFAKSLIETFKKAIAEAQQLGLIKSEEYSWQEMLEDNTGVKIDNESDIGNLSDSDLRKIRESYI